MRTEEKLPCIQELPHYKLEAFSCIQVCRNFFALCSVLRGMCGPALCAHEHKVFAGNDLALSRISPPEGDILSSTKHF